MVLQEPRIEPDPLPCLPGTPPAKMRRPDGRPPCGFTFMGAKATVDGYLLPCPICWRGWVPLAPNRHEPDGYRLAVEVGCSRGCDDPAEMMRRHLLCLGELPAPEPIEADEAARRYVGGACRHAARRIVEARDPARQLRREAYQLGQLAQHRGVELGPVMRALAVAARHAGLPTDIALPTIKNNALAGSARPGGGLRP